MKNNLFSFGCLLYAMSIFLVGGLSVKAQSLLYDNGSVFNIVGPPQVSMLQDASLGMDSYGFNIAKVNNYSIADEFTLTNESTIDYINAFVYQTGANAATITGIYIKIWNGNPSSGGTLVWGDFTTNRFASAALSGGFRQLESAPGDTARKIQTVRGNTPGLSLMPGTYWIEYTLEGTGASGPWAPPVTITGNSTTGNALQFTGSYVALVDSGTNTPQGLPFQIYGDEVAGGPFPAPYCVVSGLSSVEPITRVIVADIDNVSPNLTTAPRHEDFTSVVGNMVQGTSYEIKVEGNTSGNFTTSVHVYVDWNNDGDFMDSGEYFFGGTLVNSTGSDGKQAIGTIVVPADASVGNKRMRIIKRFQNVVPNPNDGCTGGSSFGQAEDYTINVAADGGGTSAPCSQNNPENGFENGYTTSKDGPQVIATDINIPADTDFNLEKMTVNIWMNPGVTLTSADITFYDNAGNLPGTVRSSYPAVVPVSQTVIGSAFGFDISEIVFEIAPEMLPGLEGAENRYWVSLYLDVPSGSGYIGSTSASIAGVPHTYSADGGSTWSVNTGWDTVYLFEGTCSDLGGNPGGGCTTPILEVNQDMDDSCMSNISQGGLAQSYTAQESEAAGAGIKFRDPSSGLDVTLSLWDGLPNAGGVMLATKTTQTDGTEWADVYWDSVVSVTVGDTYFIVIEGDSALPCVAGSLTNPYPGGMTYANAYAPFPNFDYTFRTYSCDGGGQPGGDCEFEHVLVGDADGGSGSSMNSDYKSAADIIVPAGQDFTLETIYVPFLTFAPEDAPTQAQVVYYSDASGLPGAQIGTETVVPTILSSGPWINPVAFEFETQLDLTPFTFHGDATNDTSYWIEVSMATATSQATVFWMYTDGAGIVGQPMVQFNATTGLWTIPEPTREVIYNFSGECAPIGGGAGCDWTVTVSSDSTFGDEVTWELRAADSTVLLSGGPYSGLPYSDTQTVNAEGPLEFFISSEGLFNDNTPVYSVSNENGVIVSGILPGGTTATFSDLNCSDAPPPPPAYACEDQTVPSGGLTNGYFFTNQLAVDIIVGDSGFDVYGAKVNVFTETGTNLNFDFNFYANAAGLPGTLLESRAGTVQETEFVGSEFGYEVYTFTVAFDTPISFNANTTYWMQVESDGIAWESTISNTLGSKLAINDGGGWAIDIEEFVYTLICEELGVSDMNSFDFAYYPNPVKDVLNIKSQKTVKSVEAFNLTGQKVISDAKVLNGQINVNALTAGTYVFKVTLEDGQVETFKIIKK